MEDGRFTDPLNVHIKFPSIDLHDFVVKQVKEGTMIFNLMITVMSVCTLWYVESVHSQLFLIKMCHYSSIRHYYFDEDTMRFRYYGDRLVHEYYTMGTIERDPANLEVGDRFASSVHHKPSISSV